MDHDIIFVPIKNIVPCVQDQDEGGFEQESLFTYFSDQAIGQRSLCTESFDISLLDLAGSSTNYLAQFFTEELAKIMRQGIFPLIPQGMDERTKDKAVFAYHLNNLIDDCLEYTDCVMILDHTHPLRLTEDDMVMELKKPKESKVKLNITYNHPKKGKIKIDTFEKCTEAYVIEATKGSKKAKFWKDLSKTMFK